MKAFKSIIKNQSSNNFIITIKYDNKNSQNIIRYERAVY